MNRWRIPFRVGIVVMVAYASSCAEPTSKLDESSDTMGNCVDDTQCAVMEGPCAQGVCVDGECQPIAANDFASCDDGQFCTIDDICQEGTCVGSASRYCPSGDNCHVAICDEGLNSCLAYAANEGATCDDGDLCTLSGTCTDGLCMGAPPVDCSIFMQPCVVGICESNVGCVALPEPDGSVCDDGKNEFCTAGRCVGGQCTTVPANDGMSCNDNLFCTIGDVCQSGVCGSQTAKNCLPPSECWIAACDESLDVCTSMTGNDGLACDDGDPCTADSVCSAGACLGGTPANDGIECNDGLLCTTIAICAAGECISKDFPHVYFVDHFASNAQGWLLGPEWEIGPAKASLGGAFGDDPPSDHTLTADNGIAGVVIGGNAAPLSHPFHYLESTAFSTADAPGTVILSFYRWLNTDSLPRMDNAVEVWDGSSWVVLWNSGAAPQVQDSPPAGSGWTFVKYDVTEYKNETMRIRFGFSAGVAAFKVGSWNVDDVVVADVACP